LPLQQIGGGIIIIFGLHLAGLFKIPILIREKRLKLPDFFNKAGYFRSFLVGVIFAFGWTACVGPILASILVLAGISATLLKGMAFLAVYSLGLSIPFLLTSLFLTEAMNYIKRFPGFLRFVPIISGSLLIILGILFLTDEFFKIVIWLYNLYNNLGIPLF
jgi:cytochrome c-type biogenesis protein